MRDIIISMGRKDNLAAISRTRTTTWDKFAEMLTREPPVTEDKASVGWFCGAEFKPAYRDSKNFVARHLLTFDYDTIDSWDVDDIKAAYKEFEYVMYTTASHTVDKPRVRVVLPLDRPATMDEFCAVTRRVGEKFDLEKLARESDVPAQMTFLPSRKPGAEFWAERNTGTWVNVNGVLGSYADWTDRGEWPKRKSGDSTHSAETVTPPTEKIGLVGDFCRAFSISAAIERFELPYEEGSGGRYTYTAGTRPDGLRVYDDDTKAHSENNGDPARGQHNAFDLVRLHKFGKLDSAAERELPITEHPSYKAMCKFVLSLPEFQVSAESEFENLEDEGLTQPIPLTEEVSAPEDDRFARPLEEWISRPTKPRWLLRERLERGVIALMVGPRGAYKSFLALDWTMQVARDHGQVYVVSAEGADYDRRAKAWLQTFAPEWDYKRQVFVAQRRIDLSKMDNVELIRQDCKLWGIQPKLFVLDTFSKLSTLDENSNTDVKKFVGLLDIGLKRTFDATVLLIAHTGHGEKSRARGASALEADTDAAYVLKKHEGAGTVSMTRERFKSSPELEPLAFKPESVFLGYKDDDGQQVTSLIMREVAPPRQRTVMPRKEPRGMYAQTALQAARELGANGASIRMADLVAHAVSKIPAAGTGRDTRAQSVARAAQGLVVDRWLFLHEDNDRVSLTPSREIQTEEWE